MDTGRTLNPPNHIYDETRIETLCGEPNTNDMLGRNVVYKDPRYGLMWRHIRQFNYGDNMTTITLGGHLYLLRDYPGGRHLCHVCEECYALYVLAAA
jgi:hypothetical protein